MRTSTATVAFGSTRAGSNARAHTCAHSSSNAGAGVVRIDAPGVNERRPSVRTTLTMSAASQPRETSARCAAAVSATSTVSSA